MELKLQKEARVGSAYSSTKIEGNRLTLNQVKDLSENKDVIGSIKDVTEVINYLKAIDNIPKYGLKPLTDKLFLQIHKTITSGTLENEKDCGNFRAQQVYVGKQVFQGTGFKTIVEYTPPKAEEVQSLVNEFLEWVNSPSTQELNPILVAGIVHYEIARIHPFIDGNGRTARLMASMILYKMGFDHKRMFALDNYYDEDRASYHAVLKRVQTDEGDITGWLEYITEGVMVSIGKVKEAVRNLKIISVAGKNHQIELSLKQIQILEILNDKSRITNKELQAVFKISRQAILKDIKKLKELKLIQLLGKGRSVFYVLVRPD
ncbi:MAG: Fic family protein [Candidatus Omnitrophica bacterium]|nr:Fic family protein [Candidatus Omnitrophota bacterium]